MTYSVSNAKIAIIGGAGFIGHHLAIGLKDRGASPEVVDSLDVNHLKQFMATPPDVPRREFYLDMLRDRLELLGVRSIPLHEQDARDAGSMRSLLVHRMKPEVVIHLAGVSNVAAVRRSPKDTFDHSLRTLSNSLSCAAELQAHFVFFSSSMAYGDFRNGGSQ